MGRLEHISFHTLRHFKATMEFQRTHNILHVMQMLGHKNINNTMIYTHLVTFDSDDYNVSTAKTVDEARELVKARFEYVTEIDGHKLFRKRKWPCHGAVITKNGGEIDTGTRFSVPLFLAILKRHP